jgi:hypothetical protein
MAPKSKDGRIRLGEPLATEMSAYRAALGQGSTEIGVIREAVREFIASRVAKDRTLRRRYEAERRRIAGQKVRPLRLVTPDKTC